jgi:hypothetical protein
MALALHYRQVLSTSEISKIVIFGRFEVKSSSEIVISRQSMVSFKAAIGFLV